MGTFGSAAGQFDSPSGIAINRTGYVFVVDFLNDRIQCFTSTGSFVNMWGTSGIGNGQFYSPQGIAINDTGYIYVADTLNYRIQVFDPMGDYIQTWGRD